MRLVKFLIACVPLSCAVASTLRPDREHGLSTRDDDEVFLFDDVVGFDQSANLSSNGSSNGLSTFSFQSGGFSFQGQTDLSRELGVQSDLKTMTDVLVNFRVRMTAVYPPPSPSTPIQPASQAVILLGGLRVEVDFPAGQATRYRSWTRQDYDQAISGLLAYYATGPGLMTRQYSLFSVLIWTNDLARLRLTMPNDYVSQQSPKIGPFQFKGSVYRQVVEALPRHQDNQCFFDAITWVKSMPANTQVATFSKVFTCSVASPSSQVPTFATLRLYGGKRVDTRPGSLTYGDFGHLLTFFVLYTRSQQNEYHELVYKAGQPAWAVAFELVKGRFQYIGSSFGSNVTEPIARISGQTNVSLPVAS